MPAMFASRMVLTFWKRGPYPHPPQYVIVMLGAMSWGSVRAPKIRGFVE
jgi:hypothetical protein